MRSHVRRAQAFTLVEMMVATGLVGVASLAMISMLVSTMKLSSQNVVTNISNYRARQTLDRLGELVRYAQATPVLITNTGSTASSTTSDGILVKNALPGMYVFKNANGKDDDIPSGSMSFLVQYVPKSTLPGIMPSADASLAGQKVEPPAVGDYFLLGLSTHPELEVASVSSVTVSGNVSSVVITTRQGITETASPKNYTVSGTRYRKEAYIFVQSGTSGMWTLRHYPRIVASTSYSSASSYVELGTGFQKMGTEAWFTTSTVNGTQATWLQAIARSSSHAEYAEKISNRTTLTTMPVQVKFWNYNPPPPSP
jgi:type II secretory pathway pseudopilin PulG